MERDIINEFTHRARRDDESKFIVDDERKKTGLGGLEQLRVVKRASSSGQEARSHPSKVSYSNPSDRDKAYA
jgi:hypothetical protein